MAKRVKAEKVRDLQTSLDITTLLAHAPTNWPEAAEYLEWLAPRSVSQVWKALLVELMHDTPGTVTIPNFARILNVVHVKLLYVPLDKRRYPSRREPKYKAGAQPWRDQQTQQPPQQPLPECSTPTPAPAPVATDPRPSASSSSPKPRARKPSTS